MRHAPMLAMPHATRARAAVVGSLAMVLLLAGCGATPAPMPVPTASTSPSASLDPGSQDLPDAVPELRPGGTAIQNQLFFEYVLEQYRAGNGIGTADALAAAVAGAGFDAATLEVTPEYTAIGLAADSIVLAVKVGGECLIGQVFADQTLSMIAAPLATGRCLVGETHPL